MFDEYEYYCPEYTTYIVDELGTPMYKVSDLTKSEMFDILAEHEEWTIRCLN